MDRAKRLGEEGIPRLLLRFSLPAIVGTLVNALYNVVDRIFIGNGVGSLALAGATIGFPIMIVTMAFGMLIGIGANALISIRLGQDRKDEAEHIMGNAAVLLLGISLFLSALGVVFLEPLLKLFGASPDVLPYARDYLRIILWGAVFQTIGFGMNNFIRAEGNPFIAMLTMLIGAVLNTILDPLFIIGFGWGVKGAAWATILSQAAAAAWVLYHFFSGRSSLRLRPNNLRLNPAIVRGILAIGSAPFLMQLAASVLHALLNRSLVRYGGDVAISAMGVVMSILMVILLPVIGISQGAQPIIGFNYGARKYDRVKRTLKLAISAATAVVSLGYIAVMLMPEALVAAFNPGDPKLIAMGARALRTFMLVLPVVGFQIIGANYFQAVSKPKQAMILNLSRQVLILIPALLILPRFLGLQGVLIAGPIADLSSALITGLWLWFELKRLGRDHAQTLEQPALHPEGSVDLDDSAPALAGAVKE
ncbi:MAG: MATE family efflux transporter [Bacteroidota bacterium]